MNAMSANRKPNTRRTKRSIRVAVDGAPYIDVNLPRPNERGRYGDKCLVDKIPDHVLNRFRFLAAKKTFSGTSTEDIVALADQTLTEGIYHDALLAINDSCPQTQAEIAPQLQLFCDDYNIPIGDIAWALQYLLGHFIARMALPNSEPDGELASLMHAVGPKTLDRIYRNQQSLGLDRILLLGMQYNYFAQLHDVPPDELESARQACMHLIPEMRDAANDWIKRYGTLQDTETSP
jgi:hypothetical protein